MNYIVPQIKKCEFITINGDGHHDKVPFPFGNSFINHVDHITLFGSHLLASGMLTDDLDLHYNETVFELHKFFNFCRENRLAPLMLKIKVLKACVVNSLIYNCETFGNEEPAGLAAMYHKLIRCVFNVRSNTHILLLYTEPGLLPIKALIETRQLKFHSTIFAFSRRQYLLNALMVDPSTYLYHYIQLEHRYQQQEFDIEYYSNDIKSRIRNFATNGRYKFKLFPSNDS